MNSEHIMIRPAQPEDAPSIAKIWFQGWQDGHLGHVPSELIEARTEPSFFQRAATRIDDTIVAVVDGAVGGFVMIVNDEIEQVYVATQYRGSGIADLVLVAGEQRIAEQHYEEAWLAVVAGNLRARRFYERRGWKDMGPFNYAAGGATRPIMVSAHRYVKRVVYVTR